MIELFNEDCLDAMDWLQDGSIDLVLTDPPYGTTACKWDTVIPVEFMWAEFLFSCGVSFELISYQTSQGRSQSAVQPHPDLEA